MYLAIEIGGTKLQLGVGRPGELLQIEKRAVNQQLGADGIRAQIIEVGQELLGKYPDVSRIGVGFGGPVISTTGITIISNQVRGWDKFPLAQWCQNELGRPAIIGNDCDVAALAEATCGVGRGSNSLFYVTVGTGIGGGLVIGGIVHGTDRPAAAEIGQLRPGLGAKLPQNTIESIAAGPAISKSVQAKLRSLGDSAEAIAAQELRELCQGNINQLTTKQLGEAASGGNVIAREAFRAAADGLGWGIAQAITLIAPEVVAIGGGVSLVEDCWFLNPVREAAAQYVFPPLRNTYRIERAGLGEDVVVYGALELAAHG